jgi:hypothetical protein
MSGSEADMRVAKCDVCCYPNSDRESGFLQKVMSALPSKADMCSAVFDACYGPKADTLTDPESSKSRNGDLQHLREMTLRSA